MNIFAGSVEIQMLCWSAVLGLVQLVIATALSIKDQGMPYSLSSRDVAGPAFATVTGRLRRAFQNFRETFVYFAVAVLVVVALNKTSAHTALGAQIYFWARLAFVPIYAAGIIVVRTLVWTASIVGIVMVLLGALA
jgi:uncharacterized MAPEG superfamily protein